MPEPNRTSNGVAYMTFDATLNTDASMIAQQKLICQEMQQQENFV